jgi:hypothetical protein
LSYVQAVHTQGIENFWSLLKRGLGGTYVAVERFHLFRYVDEQAFRFNNRKDGWEKRRSNPGRSAAEAEVFLAFRFFLCFAAFSVSSAAFISSCETPY